jgi:hypothetical protein
LIRNSYTPPPDGPDVPRIAANEALNPGQNLRPALQITQTLKPSEEALCLADFNHPPTVASWPLQRNTALLAPKRATLSLNTLLSRGNELQAEGIFGKITIGLRHLQRNVRRFNNDTELPSQAIAIRYLTPYSSSRRPIGFRGTRLLCTR